MQNNNNDLLHTEKIIADRKTFYIDLKKNARGKVVKITEDVGGNRDTIMVPADILASQLSRTSKRLPITIPTTASHLKNFKRSALSLRSVFFIVKSCPQSSTS